MLDEGQLRMESVDDAVPPGIDHGEVFTQRWVTEFILDLAGYTVDEDLAAKVIVEPSCGTGAFLVPIVERLLQRVGPQGITGCADQIRAFDLLTANVDRARKSIVEVLAQADVEPAAAESLAETWVRNGDFLLDDLGLAGTVADVVVGNPPYVRLENVSPDTMASYRSTLTTMTGRSDLYVGFYERGLRLLAEDGVLAFICADRWMHNQYGADLRAFISEHFAMDAVITMHEVAAFEDAVSAYPAITVVRARPQGNAVVATAEASFQQDDAEQLLTWSRHSKEAAVATPKFSAVRLQGWHRGRELWPAGSPTALSLVADIESRLPPLQAVETGTRVGIGVATGADGIYLTRATDLVESDRLLPMLTADDITSGTPRWTGTHLVNPWTEEGLVDLDEFPRLAEYFALHERRLRARHVGRRRPKTWYRTIDRVTPSLQHRPKLLLPDLKARSHPVLDEGSFYPHHNLYYVVSEQWDLEVLGGILLSDVANLFVGTYCVKMRAGCYRFQAQYLRQIRVPDPTSLSTGTKRALAAAFADRDSERATGIACGVYGIGETDLRQAMA